MYVVHATPTHDNIITPSANIITISISSVKYLISHRNRTSRPDTAVQAMALLGVYLAKLMIFVGCAQCVLFSEGGRVGGSVGDAGGGGEDVLDDDHRHTLTVSTAVKSCLAGADPFLPCINEQAMAAIEQTESMDSVLLDSGLEISRRPGTESFAAPRGVYSLGKPSRC